MKKLIYLLAIFLMICSVILAVINRQYLLNLHSKIEQVEKQTRLVTTDLGAKEDIQDELESQEFSTQDAKQKKQAQLAAIRSELTIINRKTDQQKRQIETAEIEILEFNQLIKLHFPDGKYQTPEQLEAIYQANLAKKSSLNEYKQELESEIESITNRNIHRREKIGEEELIQLDNQRKVLLSELHARVIAINSDYGFVILNVGALHGLDAQKTFVVKRGNQRVGRLRIINLTDQVCLCDIVAESKDNNNPTKISVGDSAIIETPLASN